MSNTSSAKVERKNRTAPANISVQEKLAKSSYYNVLNKYRSYTYNFTLAALNPNQSSTESYRTQEKLDNVILKSSGKAEKGEIPKVKITYGNPPAWVQEEIDYFNSESAGRYDLYIDNVEIENVPTPALGLGTGLVTNIKFDVIEPYSSVGFIEALIATARASGYLFHTNAVYLLKIEFKGYRDDADVNEPAEIIPNSTRYIPLRFTNIEVEITQAGTVYKCECRPSGDIALADDSGSVKTPIQISGVKVKEILQDLFKKLNAQNLDAAKKIDKNIKESEVDSYEVLFPTLNGTEYDITKENSIADKPLKKLFSDNTIYEFGNIDSKQFATAYQQTGIVGQERKFVAYEPNKISVSYAPGSTIQSMIDGIVRDSEYWREQIDPNTAKLSSDDDHVKFWKIVPKVSEENKSINPVLKRYARHIVYNIIEEKIHKSRVPVYNGFTYGDENIRVIREYNYIYTGQNVDITNLKINLDRLFITSIPWGLGNNDNTPVRSALLPGNSTNLEIKPQDPQLQVPGGDTPAVTSAPTNNTGGNAQTAGELARDAIANLARVSFDQVIASPFSMIKADMDILGDPVYIMTNINTNRLPKLSSDDPAFTQDGEANFLSQAVYIKIFFRSPTDIDDGMDELTPAEKREGRLRATGLARFTSRYDWTGVWMLVRCYSYFRNGVFTQKLELRREPIAISNLNNYKPPEVLETVPNEKDKVVSDAGARKIIPPNKRSSLQNLLQGVTNVADSLANVEARIVGAVQGTLETVATGAAEIAAIPAKAISNVTNEINGALQGLNNSVTDAANRLNLNPSQISSLSAKELLATIAISKLLPNNVDAGKIEEKDLFVSKTELSNLPPLGNDLNLSDSFNIDELQKQTQLEVELQLELLSEESTNQMKNKVL